MMKPFFKIIESEDFTEELLKRLSSLSGTGVLVGIPAANTERPPSLDDPLTSDPFNNAQIGYLMEFGSPATNTPARPFLIPGIKDAREVTVKLLAVAGKTALNGGSVKPAMNAIGLKNQVAVKKRITSNTPPPLAPSTLAARRRRGVTRTNTLVDTGALLNSISYVVREGGK